MSYVVQGHGVDHHGGSYTWIVCTTENGKDAYTVALRLERAKEYFLCKGDEACVWLRNLEKLVPWAMHKNAHLVGFCFVGWQVLDSNVECDDRTLSHVEMLPG